MKTDINIYGKTIKLFCYLPTWDIKVITSTELRLFENFTEQDLSLWKEELRKNPMKSIQRGNQSHHASLTSHVSAAREQRKRPQEPVPSQREISSKQDYKHVQFLHHILLP